MSTSTIDAYTEADLNNSGLAMRFDEIERDSLIAHVGFRVSIAKSTERGVVLPQFRLEYEHEYEDPTTVAASFVLDAARVRYGLTGDEPDRNYFETGVGVAWVLPSGWQPFVDVEFLSGQDALDRYRVAAGFRVEF
jgi:outer membrane autotransporter protein